MLPQVQHRLLKYCAGGASPESLPNNPHGSRVKFAFFSDDAVGRQLTLMMYEGLRDAGLVKGQPVNYSARDLSTPNSIFDLGEGAQMYHGTDNDTVLALSFPDISRLKIKPHIAKYVDKSIQRYGQSSRLDEIVPALRGALKIKGVTNISTPEAYCDHIHFKVPTSDQATVEAALIFNAHYLTNCRLEEHPIARPFILTEGDQHRFHFPLPKDVPLEQVRAGLQKMSEHSWRAHLDQLLPNDRLAKTGVSVMRRH